MKTGMSHAAGAIDDVGEEVRDSVAVIDDAVLALGARIRRLRLERHLTLQVMSDRTGLSASMISMVERGRTSPSIGTLVAIASALRIHMSELFDGETVEARSPVRRRNEQPTVATASGVVRRLVQDDEDRGLELTVNEYAPATVGSTTPVHHGGVEYGLVLHGTVVVELADATYELRAGDSIAYDSSIPHRITNPGRSHARTVWLNLERS
jgi:transcriptional regulator with XRE-family HTH domain